MKIYLIVSRGVRGSLPIEADSFYIADGAFHFRDSNDVVVAAFPVAEVIQIARKDVIKEQE